jgi:hypothetical protein
MGFPGSFAFVPFLHSQRQGTIGSSPTLLPSHGQVYTKTHACSALSCSSAWRNNCRSPTSYPHNPCKTRGTSNSLQNHGAVFEELKELICASPVLPKADTGSAVSILTEQLSAQSRANPLLCWEQKRNPPITMYIIPCSPSHRQISIWQG